MGRDLKGTKWICKDIDSEHFGDICTVLGGEYIPEYNGENTVEIKYLSGTIIETKFRRFYTSHTEISDSKISQTEVGVNLTKDTFVGIDWGSGEDKSVMVKLRKNNDGTITVLDIKELPKDD